ncbi:MAG TPA: type II secretion system protein N [Usitatibacter sp.]|nr:type II secretion system protein N [Usitatibacter sp.]
MRAAPLVLLGVVAYAAFALATMPARFAAAQLEDRARNAVHIADASGTVWHGAARAQVDAGGASIVLDNVAWRWLPAELASGKLAFAIDARAGDAQLNGTVARSLALWHASGTLDAAAAFAATAYPLLGTFRPEGRITARSDGIAWNDREARGEAVAEWRAAAIALSDVRPLGSYRVKLQADGAAMKLDASTLEGPLRIVGQGTVTPPGAVTFNGEARAEGPNARALEPLLGMLGPKRADGAHTLQWRTR